MATDPRIFSILDDLEGVTYETSFRIPPLQDPLPFIPSRRPPPLEPIARVNDGTRNATAKLGSRANALAKARLIGDDDSPNAYKRAKAIEAANAKPGDSTQEARKRQKLDFVQLPEPTTRSKASKPLSFKPVPVLLNELHEPPPSAALFPPITPTVQHEESQEPRLDDSSQHAIKVQAHSGLDSSSKLETALEIEQHGRAKRVCLRGRRNWTDEETEDLLKGVSIYGIGKWKKILHHEGFTFHPERTTVDLKDRLVLRFLLQYQLNSPFSYRTCRLNEERALERQASGKTKAKPTNASVESIKPRVAVSVSFTAVRCKSPKDSSSKGPRTPEEQSFSIFTPQSFSQTTSSPRIRKDAADKDGRNKMVAPRWTHEEDTNLSKGYQKYGFQWTAITKDPDMKLSHRTGAQVRDRFRLKFPAHYQASIPLPLPEVAKRVPRVKTGQPTRNVRRSLEPQNKKAGGSRSGTPQAQFRFIVHDPRKPPGSGKDQANCTTLADNEASSRSKTGTESSELSLHIERDAFSALNVQPLPDPDPTSSSESTASASQSTGERSRQSSAEAEEARHLGILGLLNDEDEQSSRLPPFKYPFDDDWGGGSVTLPPLLWEDIASRPIFDLE